MVEGVGVLADGGVGVLGLLVLAGNAGVGPVQEVIAISKRTEPIR
jgi:hypothetical protein